MRVLAWILFVATALYAWPVRVLVSVELDRIARITLVARIGGCTLLRISAIIRFPPLSVQVTNARGRQLGTRKRQKAALALEDVFGAIGMFLSGTHLDDAAVDVCVGVAGDAASTALLTAAFSAAAEAVRPKWEGAFLSAVPTRVRVSPDFSRGVLCIRAESVSHTRLGRILRILLKLVTGGEHNERRASD